MVDRVAKTGEAETANELDEVTPDKQDVGEELEIVEEAPDLDEQLTEAQAQAAEYLDGWQRARAELANFKRRTEAQRTEMILSANSNLLTKLLPVLDDLQLALDNSPQ